MYQFDLWQTPQERTARVDVAAERLNDPDFHIGQLEITPIKSGRIFYPKTFEEKILIRHLNNRIRRAYKIRPPNRDAIVAQVKQLLRTDAPVTIVRTDIRHFFRSVPFAAIIEQLKTDGLLCLHEIDVLRDIAGQVQSTEGRGIPWGLALSSTLAELYMRPFDQRCRAISGLSYFQRFVDDMIAVSSTPAEEVAAAIESSLHELSPELRLNKSKTIKQSEPFPPIVFGLHFHFLGYEFRRQPFGKTLSVTLHLSQRKLQRLRRRIDRVIKAFVRRPNWRMLSNRIKLLTGNYDILRSEHSTRIKAGIYFSHPDMTDCSQLNLLDRYLRCQLVRLRVYARKNGIPGANKKLKAILRNSFVKGFEKRIVHRMHISEVEKSTSAWKYVR